MQYSDYLLLATCSETFRLIVQPPSRDTAIVLAPLSWYMGASSNAAIPLQVDVVSERAWAIAVHPRMAAHARPDRLLSPAGPH